MSSKYKTEQYDFKEILDTKTMILWKVERRLILKALIISKFNIPRAFKINCAGSFVEFDTYDRKFRKYFPCGSVKLKELWIKYNNEKATSKTSI